VIVVDGSIHNIPYFQQNDKQRQKHLEVDGFKVLGFSNNEIRSNIAGVSTKIELILSLAQTEKKKQRWLKG
jgi:very-short-patch-repair endonuclease